MPLSVDYADLSLAQQLLERQSSEHLANMRSFLKQWGDYSDGGEGAGLLMMAFNPVNQFIVEQGDNVLELLEDVHGGAADHMAQTIDAYVSADQKIHAALSAATQALGGSPLPFNDPRSSLPTLGAAEQSASKWYGGAEPNILRKITDGSQALGEYLSEVPDRATMRATKALSSNRSISEYQDASSYLVPPEAPEAEMSNLRWSAGVIIGGIDWLIEKLTGTSLLNDIIFKYTVGDWRVLDRASTAWNEIGDALFAVGQNDTEILPSLSEWTGKGSEVANIFITALAGGTSALKVAAKYTSEAIKIVSEIVKLVASGIASILRGIQRRCLLMLAMSTLPIAGWAYDALQATELAYYLYRKFKKIYNDFNKVYEAIETYAEAKDELVEIGYIISNLAEAIARGVVARS